MQATINLAAELHQPRQTWQEEEPQSQDDRVKPKQPASTALATIEETIIEGEVTAIIEPVMPPTPKQHPYYLLPLFTLLACLLIIGVPHMWQLLTPTATVTIIPREENISFTGAIPIHGRVLPALTLSQSTTVPATGKRHQNATRATGEITLYNGLFTSQTIGAGTILTGADGVAIITDQAAVIPAGIPPVYGQTIVSAHAVDKGASGNILAYDINTACCLTSVLAKNTEAFSGGLDARDYIVVTKSDIHVAAAAIQATLIKSEQAALNVQLNPGETLLAPACTPTTTADHRTGDEAREVTVMVSDTCSSLAYPSNVLRQNATQMIHEEAMQRLGIGYSLVGDMQVSIIHTTITDQARGIATLMVKLDTTYVYQMNPGELKMIMHLIAGKSKESAVRTIVRLPGIQGAAINSNASALPADPGKITIIIVNRSA